jgi:hypothetical protein
MDAWDYVSWVANTRQGLARLWKLEPIYTSLWTKDILGKEVLVPCFIHPKDRNRTTIKSLRYTHREI